MKLKLLAIAFVSLAAIASAGAQPKAPSTKKIPIVPVKAPVLKIAPPAEHTPVLAFIEPNEPTCHSKELTSSEKEAGISKRVMYVVTKPDRTFFVTASTTNDPLAFSGTVSWGTKLPTEQETADASFGPDGSVIKAVKFLGYAGPKGAGATYPLTADELAKVRALSTEILKRCSA